MLAVNKLRSPGYQLAIGIGIVATVALGYAAFPAPDEPLSRILRVALLAALGAIFGILAHDVFTRMRGGE
jgi:hypothetical protein